jgi:hypothetical protein
MNILNSKDAVHNDFTKYIYINEHSLSNDFCEKMIKLHDSSKEKNPGLIFSGVNKNIKDTTDVMTYGESWNDYTKTLREELDYNILEYVERFKHDDYKGYNNHSTRDYSVIQKEGISKISQFMVQKYNKGEGRYTYHNDFSLNASGDYRVLTYLWYLNDVDEGGETAFSGIYCIKPKRGTLILFPSAWTFPHCGKMPISHDKYIITGWIYSTYISMDHR